MHITQQLNQSFASKKSRSHFPVDSLRKSTRSLVREFGFFQTNYADTQATHGESHVLIEINRLGALEVGELARMLNMEKTSASKLLSQMEAKGWLKFSQPIATDKRKKIYSLTTAGIQLTKKIEKIASDRMELALSELAPDELKSVEHSLAVLAQALRTSRARSQFVIRPCEPKDNKAIASIVKRSLKDFGFAGPGTAAADETVNNLSGFNSIRSCYLVAELKGEIMGGAGIMPMQGEAGNVCELVRMFLHPEARSSGIAQILIDNALERAKRFGYKICYLETTEEMQAAQRLYLKNGFKFVTKRRGNTGHFACNVLMEKILKV